MQLITPMKKTVSLHGSLSSPELVQRLKFLVQTERKLTFQILNLLEEIDERKTFLEMGYGSLLDFCTQELRYSESAAYRRIQAMQARRDLPQIGPAIIDGSLPLTIVAKAQSFIRAEEKKNQMLMPSATKVEIFSDLQNKSMREAEKVLIARLPESAPTKESIRLISSEMTEIKVLFNSSQMLDLNHIKKLLSHRIPEANYAKTIHWMIEDCLRRLNPLTKNVREKTRTENKLIPGKREKIPAKLKQLVWKKARGQCCYKNLLTGKRCDSRFQLEIDHKTPLSKGGSHHIDNLQLLCRAHNQWKGND